MGCSPGEEMKPVIKIHAFETWLGKEGAQFKQNDYWKNYCLPQLGFEPKYILEVTNMLSREEWDDVCNKAFGFITGKASAMVHNQVMFLELESDAVGLVLLFS